MVGRFCDRFVATFGLPVQWYMLNYDRGYFHTAYWANIVEELIEELGSAIPEYRLRNSVREDPIIEGKDLEDGNCRILTPNALVSFEYRVVITKTKRLPFLEGGAVLEYLLLRIRNINYRERDGGHIELSLTFLAHSRRTDNFVWYRILRMHWAPGITPVVTNLKCKMYLTVPVNSCGGKDIGPFYEQFSLQCLRELVSRCITTYASVVRLRGSKICWNQHSERMTGIVDNRWHLFVPEETSLGISDRLFGQGQGTIQAFSTVRRLQWRSRGASNRP